LTKHATTQMTEANNNSLDGICKIW